MDEDRCFRAYCGFEASFGQDCYERRQLVGCGEDARCVELSVAPAVGGAHRFVTHPCLLTDWSGDLVPTSYRAASVLVAAVVWCAPRPT